MSRLERILFIIRRSTDAEVLALYAEAMRIDARALAYTLLSDIFRRGIANRAAARAS